MLEIIIFILFIYFIFFNKSVENMSLICKQIENKENQIEFDCSKKINVNETIQNYIENNEAYNLIVESKSNAKKNLKTLDN